MISLNIDKKEDLEKKVKSDVTESIYYGTIIGMGVGLVATTIAGYYIPHDHLSKSIIYTSPVQLLINKPLMLVGSLGGAVIGGVSTYFYKTRR